VCLIEIESWRIKPVILTVKRGQSGYINCNSTDLPKWTFKNSPDLPINSKVSGNNVYLYSVEIYNNGFLECEGRTENSHTFFALAKVVVIGK